jgi:hypothetical protein
MFTSLLRYNYSGFPLQRQIHQRTLYPAGVALLPHSSEGLWTLALSPRLALAPWQVVIAIRVDRSSMRDFQKISIDSVFWRTPGHVCLHELW